MSIRIPFEAKLLLLTCLALVLLGCGSGETSSTSDNTTLSLEEANLSEFPIVYVKRAIAEETRELTDLDGMTPGAELYVRGTASSESPEVNLTQRIFGAGVQYDVKDINISYDGNFMVFAARGPFDDTVDEDEEQPTQWNLYEYSFTSGEVYSIMNSTEAARGHDITPHYLADGRLIFASTRQTRAGTIMLDEGKPQYTYQVEDMSDERGGPAFALHLAEFDGNRNLSLVEQVTFNMSHDFDPVLMDNGKVVFTRWDNVRSSGRDQISYYRMNPDGAGLELLYGYDSHETDDEDIEVQYANPQVSPDGQLISLLRTFDGEGYEPNIVKIDIANFVDINTPIGSASGSAESPVTKFETATDPEEISAGGRFSYIMPLEDGTNRAIVSWSFCRLQNSDGTVASCSGVDLSQDDLVEAPPNYGLWLFDFDEDTQIPLVLGEGNTQAFFDIAFAIPRTPPVSISDVSPVLAEDSTNPCSPGFFEQDDGYGMVHIRSVYDWDGAFYSNWVTDPDVTNIAQLADPVAVTADERSARFLRLDKPVYIPDEDLKEIPGTVIAQGAYAAQMREILGFAPIQPDGSVKVKVPADVPFVMTVVDRYGRRLSDSNEHRNWLQVRPGEVMECSGCHDPSSDEPHGRREARPTSINSGASAGVDFPNTNPEVYNVDVDGETEPRDCAPGSGETMAEVYVRTDASRANISPDLVFDDVWTDPAQRTPDTSFAHRYSDIETVYEAGETNGDEDTGVLPYNRGACADEWDSYCRIVINYEDHIQPLWEVTRTVTTDDGPVNYKCIDCHGAVDPDDGSDQIPAGQLTLTNELDNQDRYASFGEVISNNDIAVVDDGDGNPITLSGDAIDNATDRNVIPELVRQDDGSYCYRLPDNTLVVAATEDLTEIVTDEEGEAVLDENGNAVTQVVLDDDGFPVPATYTVPEGNLGYNIRLQRGIRSRSNNFRAIFDPGFEYGGSTVCGVTRNARALDFDHSQDGVFSESELKLLWDWLGAGSAYFNNPFAVPD